MKKIWMVWLLFIFSFAVNAQNSHNENKNEKQASKSNPLPDWAPALHYDATAHAYFPDYYTFYDAGRGGYVYWENGTWTFSPAVPPYLKKVDLRKSRIKILKELSLDLHPELNYPYYMKMYPPDPNGNTLVPVPIPGNPAGH
jgi:hypothetical protein